MPYTDAEYNKMVKADVIALHKKTEEELLSLRTVATQLDEERNQLKIERDTTKGALVEVAKEKADLEEIVQSLTESTKEFTEAAEMNKATVERVMREHKLIESENELLSKASESAFDAMQLWRLRAETCKAQCDIKADEAAAQAATNFRNDVMQAINRLSIDGDSQTLRETKSALRSLVFNLQIRK